jgi:hypothetical protein
MPSRRTFLSGTAAVATSTLTSGFPTVTAREASDMTYEEGLAAKFRGGEYHLGLLALAHVGGFDDRLPNWLKLAQEAEPSLDVADLRRVFDAVLSGDVERIERSVVGDLTPDALSGKDAVGAGRLDEGLADVAIRPLTLLGRGDVLVALHDNAVERMAERSSAVTVTAALSLGEAGDWRHARRILERARTTANIPIGNHAEELLWKHAYLHGEVDGVMPLLAEMPFRTDEPIRADVNAWTLKAYQIRRGIPGIEVMPIERKYHYAYLDAIAMQIARLETDPNEAGRVDALRKAIMPERTINFIHADRGLSLVLDTVGTSLLKARAAVIARSRNYDLAAALARTPLANAMLDAPYTMIACFLEEGDWQGAAAIAAEHDPRQRSVPPGFDDDRLESYVRLYDRLAVAAAWAGDDAAAAGFFRRAKEGWEALLAEHPDDYAPEYLDWSETLLAGAAEGRLPRKLLYVLLYAFFHPY